MNTLFLTEGTNIQTGVYNNTVCEYLKKISTKQYFSTRHASKVMAIASYNNIVQFDPIEGYYNSEVIYKFVKSSSSANRKTKAKLFELAVIRGAKEILVQTFPSYNELAKTDPVKCITEMLSDKTPLIQLTHNFLPHVAKAFIKLKQEGHFKKNYKPDSVYATSTFSVKKAVQHVQKNYKIKQPAEGYGFEINLNYFIATSITPKLTEIANQNSKINLKNTLKNNPDVTEVYAFLGIDHLDIISKSLIQDNKKTFQEKYPPIHKTFSINDNAIKFHIFPDRHGTAYAYKKLAKYAGNHGIKVPTSKQSLEITTEYICNNAKQSLSFSDAELNFLICISNTNSHSFDALKTCDTVFDMKNQITPDPSLCDIQDGTHTFSWYNDFLLRGTCDTGSHDEL